MQLNLDRRLDMKEIKEPGALLRTVWCGFDPKVTPTGSRDVAVIACVLRLSILTLQRPSEVAAMTTDRVNVDSGSWLIPRRRGHHVVPLTPLARSLVRLALSLRRRSASATIFQDRNDADAHLTTRALRYEFKQQSATLPLDKGVSVWDVRQAARLECWSITDWASFLDIYGHHRPFTPERQALSAHFFEWKYQTLAAWEDHLNKIVRSPQISDSSFGTADSSDPKT
jgi:hypothetical protein